MRFLRSLRGKEIGAAEGTPPAGAPAGSGETTGARDTQAADGLGDEDDLPEDDAAREARLQRDFQAGLSDLARRQLQFAAYATQPPGRINHAGTWYVTEVTETREVGGQPIVLDEKTPLDFVSGDDDAVSTDGTRVLRFRIRNGREVELDVPADEDWPALLVREADLGPGSSSGA